MKNPNLRSRSHHAFTSPSYILAAISYLLISGSALAWDDEDADDWQAGRWRDVETVAGAFVASGPFYKGGQACVITDKGLVYSTGRGSVVAPDGYYYRSGNLWVGPNGKMFSEAVPATTDTSGAATAKPPLAAVAATSPNAATPGQPTPPKLSRASAQR